MRLPEYKTQVTVKACGSLVLDTLRSYTKVKSEYSWIVTVGSCLPCFLLLFFYRYYINENFIHLYHQTLWNIKTFVDVTVFVKQNWICTVNMLYLKNNYFKSAFIDIENLHLKKQFCLQVGFIIVHFLDI